MRILKYVAEEITFEFKLVNFLKNDNYVDKVDLETWKEIIHDTSTYLFIFFIMQTYTKYDITSIHILIKSHFAKFCLCFYIIIVSTIWFYFSNSIFTIFFSNLNIVMLAFCVKKGIPCLLLFILRELSSRYICKDCSRFTNKFIFVHFAFPLKQIFICCFIRCSHASLWAGKFAYKSCLFLTLMWRFYLETRLGLNHPLLHNLKMSEVTNHL